MRKLLVTAILLLGVAGCGSDPTPITDATNKTNTATSMKPMTFSSLCVRKPDTKNAYCT